jgi:hypothetical protein
MNRTQERYSPVELTRQHIEAGRSSHERDLQKEVEFYKKRHDKLVTKLATIKVIRDDPKQKLVPSVIEMLMLYLSADRNKPAVRLTWKDGEVINCTDWSCTPNMFFSFDGSNDYKGEGNGDIEVNIDPECPPVNGKRFDNTDPKFTLILKDLAYLSEKEKAEYYALCKIIYVNNAMITKVDDAPSSILWMLRNKVDAFDLIQNGLAERV